MKLKCVGGELDGQERDIEDTYKEHDQVRLALPLEFKLSSFAEDVRDFREGRVPKHTVTSYANYKISSIHGTNVNGNKLKILYLTPMNWHEWEAIEYLVNAHAPRR